MNEHDIPDLPYLTLERLLAHPPEGGAAYLMRHAERAPLSGPETIIFADLTEKGWEDARRFGRELATAFRISGVYCSPVNRCLHTGAAIIEGAKAAIVPQTRWWLFSPFLKAHNQDGGELIRIKSTTKPDMGVAGLNRNNLRTAIERIKIPSSPGTINLYIAHDSTVTPATGFLLGYETVWVDQYPGYLEGVVLVRDGAGKAALYRPG